jgi:hypothetical protein
VVFSLRVEAEYYSRCIETLSKQFINDYGWKVFYEVIKLLVIKYFMKSQFIMNDCGSV